ECIAHPTQIERRLMITVEINLIIVGQQFSRASGFSEVVKHAPPCRLENVSFQRCPFALWFLRSAEDSLELENKVTGDVLNVCVLKPLISSQPRGNQEERVTEVSPLFFSKPSNIREFVIVKFNIMHWADYQPSTRCLT